MYNFTEENKYYKKGYKFIGGIDEAGRGPLAGPVVAVCVVCTNDLKINDELLKIKDSKKIPEKKREALVDIIKNNFYELGIGICDHETIDRINILQATFLAMKKAISAVKEKPDMILVDGNFKIPTLNIEQSAEIKGDNRIITIAAASIVAKVVRDKIMIEYDKIYPGYGFKKHKGYGTKQHMIALKELGPCPIHRKSFTPVMRML